MPNVVSVEPGKLGAVIRADGRNMAGVMRRGMRRGAQKTRTRLVRLSPVDRGMLKNAWDIVNSFFGGDGKASGLEVVNTAPYAGVIERGARPFVMPRWVVEGPLKEWVMRKIIGRGTAGGGRRAGPMTPTQDRRRAAAGGFSGRGGSWEQEALSIAYAIRDKVKRVGFAGKFFVRGQLPQATEDAVTEIMREVQKYYQKRRGTGELDVQ